MASSAALELSELKKPAKPRAPKQPDLRKLKDEAKIAAKKEAYRVALAKHKEEMREYNEVLYPAYEKEYQRAYDQGEKRKRKRQDAQAQRREAKAEASPHREVPSLRLLSLRALERQLAPQFVSQHRSRRTWCPSRECPTREHWDSLEDFISFWHTSFANAARQSRGHGVKKVTAAEGWPSYTLHQRQAAFCEHLGLLAEAEREWRAALRCTPARETWAVTLRGIHVRTHRSTLVLRVADLMRRRARGEYGREALGLPEPGKRGGDRWKSGVSVWREGTAMAGRAEREREAEAERDGPKTAGEIHASEKLL